MRFWWLSGSNMGEHNFPHVFGGRHVWKVSLWLEKKSLPNLAGHGKGAADVIPFQMTRQANFFRNLSKHMAPYPQLAFSGDKEKVLSERVLELKHKGSNSNIFEVLWIHSGTTPKKWSIKWLTKILLSGYFFHLLLSSTCQYFWGSELFCCTLSYLYFIRSYLFLHS